MSIFDFDDYKKFVGNLVKSMPRKGRGQYKHIAEHLNISTVVVSQVFKGERQLTPEQACDLSIYLGLSDLERDYLLLLVQLARAGTHRLKLVVHAQLQSLKEKSQDLKSRLPQDKTLSDEAKAIFYSNWYYSGIRLLTSIDGMHNIDAIAQSLDLPRATVKRVADFLIAHGLCIEEGNKIVMGPKRTHLEASSPLVSRHHINWRMKGIENMEGLSPEELFFSGPMTVSAKTAQWVRKELVELIERISKVVEDSKSEELLCLNIDWFKFQKGR